MIEVECDEALRRSLPELRDGNAAVKVRIGRSDGLGKVEQAIATGALVAIVAASSVEAASVTAAAASASLTARTMTASPTTAMAAASISAASATLTFTAAFGRCPEIHSKAAATPDFGCDDFLVATDVVRIDFAVVIDV
jgi:hypothetical protein